MKTLIALTALTALACAAPVVAKSAKEVSPHGLGERSVFSERATAERVKPVGQVCIEGEDCAAAVVEVAAAPRSGEAVYNGACMACHASGAAGAPKVGDKAAWAPRIGKGMSTLVEHSLQGFNAMPPKGLCMDCSDDEIKAAVKYMVGKSQ